MRCRRRRRGRRRARRAARCTSREPGRSRRRRVSQPSIHLPRSVYSSSCHTGARGLEQVLLRREELVVGGDHAPPSALGGEIDQIRETESLIDRRSAVRDAIERGIRRVPDTFAAHERRATMPSSVRPAYGVSLWRWCSRLGLDANVRVRIPDDEVGVVARRDPALAVARGRRAVAGARRRRSTRAQLASSRCTARAPRDGGPDGPQQAAKLQRRDAAPRASEVAVRGFSAGGHGE